MAGLVLMATRLFGIALAVVWSSVTLPAGFVKQWRLTDVEQAPVLIVGRVESVRANFPLPRGSFGWDAETWAMTSEVEVLRSYSSSGVAPQPRSRISVGFLAYGEASTMSIDGRPPPLAWLDVGDVVMIPLREREARWTLLDTQGLGLTIPMRAEFDETLPQSSNGRQFILREIANSLSHGTPCEMSPTGAYVHGESQNLKCGTDAAAQSGDWLGREALAAVVVNLMGTTPPGLQDLRAGSWVDANWNHLVDHGYSIASAIQGRLPNDAQSARFLSDAVIERMSCAPEFAGFLAGEFLDNDYFVQRLVASLKQGRAGSLVVVAGLLKRGGERLLPAAVEAARTIAAHPKESPHCAQLRDREAAAEIVGKP